MINLIPPQAKKKVRIEYIARLCVVVMVALVCLFVIAGSLAVPNIVFLRSQHEAIALEHERSSGENNTIATHISEIEEVNTFVSNIHGLLQFDPVVPLLATIQAYETEQVSFKSITLNRDEGVVSSLQITGIASTRQALADLREQLLADPAVSEVDLPLGNLAKDKDLSFNITVHLATKDS